MPLVVHKVQFIHRPLGVCELKKAFLWLKILRPWFSKNRQYSCWAVGALRAHLGLQLWRQPPVSGRWPGIWCHSSSNSSQRWS